MYKYEDRLSRNFKNGPRIGNFRIRPKGCVSPTRRTTKDSKTVYKDCRSEGERVRLDASLSWCKDRLSFSRKLYGDNEDLWKIIARWSRE